MRKCRLSFSLRAGMSILVFSIIGLSYWGFFAYSYLASSNVYKENALKYISKHNNEIGFKLEVLLNPIGNSLKIIRKQISDSPGYFTSQKFAETLLLHLQNQKDLISIFIASASGDYMQVQNTRPSMIVAGRVAPVGAAYNKWNVVRSDESVADIVSRYSFYGPANQLIDSFDLKNKYDPRQRPFYKNIERSMVADPGGDFVQIDPPYIASSTKQYTFTLTTPVVSKKKLLGMVGQSFEIRTISNFFQSNKISKNSQTFVVDASGKIIIGTDFEKMFYEKDGAVASRSLLDYADPAVNIAAAERSRAANKPFEFVSGEQSRKYLAQFSPVPNKLNQQWEILSVAPLEDFLEEMEAANHSLLVFGAGLAIILLIIFYYVVKVLISKPVEGLVFELQQLLEFNNSSGVHRLQTRIEELGILADAINRLKVTLNAFVAYVPRDLVGGLLKSGRPIEIGGESRYMTILFSDLQGFSSLSEVTPTRELLRRVSAYLELMTFSVKEERGTVDKFIGDSVMAFWGAPELNQNHAYHACVAAIRGMRRMVKLNDDLVAAKAPPLVVRIGIHSDAVLVGNIGSMERLSYTVMGDGVNVASRLEGVNKEFSTNICISHAVFMEAGERLCVRPIDLIKVKGRAADIAIYELLGIRDGDAETRPTARDVELGGETANAFASYRAGAYAEAAALYDSISQQFNDPLSRIMAEKCLLLGRRDVS